MCGINGIFAYAEGAAPVDEAEVLRTREAMIRRGPDGAGLWISPDRRIGLGHRRLAVIDPSDAGAQPMATAEGHLRIVFNGEIYNYRELRAGLQAKGHVFRSASDTEVLLRLYEERGEDMVHDLRGMYAFALWDERGKGLFLARDPFGIKPLHYADDGGTLRFASQVKALVGGGAIDCHPDAAAYAGFLTWGCVPEPFTLHREIGTLPAGSHLWIDSRGAREPVTYFSVREEFLRAGEAAAGGADTQGERPAIGFLEESVRRHMVADVPVAAFLSAGLDSTTTVALASRVPGQRLRTLTLGFDEFAGGPHDETGLAAEVARRYGVDHTERRMTRRDFEENLDAIFDAMDQPSTDGVNTYLVSKAAADAGMKVALSGLGGDELLRGYPSFRDVPRIRRLARATGLSPAFGRFLRKTIAPVVSRTTSPKFAGLLEYGRDDAGAYLLRRGLFMPWELPRLMDPELAAQGWERLRTLSRLEAGCRGLAAEDAIVSTLELTWYMRNQLLRDTDWAGMAHSLEIRVPFLDLDFFRALLRMSAAGRAPSKAGLARQVEPPLPESIVGRPKTGFLAPVREWCVDPARAGAGERGLRSWARIVLARSLAATDAGFVDPETRRLDFGPRWRREAVLEAAARASAFREAQSPARRLLRRAQAGAAMAAYVAANSALRVAAYALWPGKRPAEADRVCVYRIGNIGDLVCAAPAIAAVRRAYPGARLTLFTSPGKRGMPGAADFLDGSGLFDELLVYHADDIDTQAKRSALLRTVRACRFDVWIDLPNNLSTASRQFRDMAFARLAGARWGRGWAVDSLGWVAQAQSEYLRFPDEVERMAALVRGAGIAVDGVDCPLPRSAQARERIDALLRERGLDGSRLVAIAPGAKRSTNLWEPERFAEVGRELTRRGCAVLLVGGEGEAADCLRISAQVGAGAHALGGRLSLPESCELLRRCELAICVDSGVQHLASAVGTPCLSLFSFWQMRGKWHPHGERNVVLQRWVPCHTCLLETCPNGNACMKAISAGEVVCHADDMLFSRNQA